MEKFIGDAVMAVWGSPQAREDDAERAVRAALALTQSVTALGQEVGVPELRVRAGVLTGRAAVELGAESEGMVLGDTVNTASRLQSIAHPGCVLVDDITRRASEAAIAFEDAGVHQVKGARAASPGLDGAAGRRRRRRRATRGWARSAVRRTRGRARGGHRVSRGQRGGQSSAARHRASARRAPGSRACCGSSSSTSTGVRRTGGGIRVVAFHTARGWHIGRSRRW